jgi:hypothetical protein
MCNCGCQETHKQSPAVLEEKKTYVCSQCNTFKEAEATQPRPECCGKAMQEMD